MKWSNFTSFFLTFCYNEYGDIMKKLLSIIFLATIFFVCYFFRQEIISYAIVNIIYPDQFAIKESNKYYVGNDFEFVQSTSDFTPGNKQELLNVFYTILDNGWNSFSFLCESEYSNCIPDIQVMLADEYLLTDLNNFVHPYNSYNKFKININSLGRVEVTVDKLYSDEEIKTIDEEVNRIYKEYIKDEFTTTEKIKTIYDYIINATVYQYEDGTDSYPLKTNKAYGSLINNSASCSGYTDAMALFLYKIGIKNYRISSAQHIWNLVYIDNNWKHLDLTWDDPVTSTGENLLTHNFFLISSKELEAMKVDEHDFNPKVFIEAS